MSANHLVSDLSAAKSEIARLNERIAELHGAKAKDAARIDWMEARTRAEKHFEMDLACDAEGIWLVDLNGQPWPTLREAIDAAMRGAR